MASCGMLYNLVVLPTSDLQELLDLRIFEGGGWSLIQVNKMEMLALFFLSTLEAIYIYILCSTLLQLEYLLLAGLN